MTNSESRWVQPKWFASSKTFWLNLLTMAVALLLLLSQQEWMPERGVEIILLIQGVLNLVLRFLTDAPIQMVKPK